MRTYPRDVHIQFERQFNVHARVSEAHGRDLTTLNVRARNAGKLSRQAHITNSTFANSSKRTDFCREAFFHSISCLHTEMCQSKVVFKRAEHERSAAGVRVTIVFK